MRSKTKVSNAPIYQLKITLKGSKPPIWRRIQVSGDVTLATLHAIIQKAMGWWDSHLHAFEIQRQEYGVPTPDWDLEFADERKAILALIAGPKDRFVYQYDFGDDWLHQIVVEKIVAREKEKRYPICLAGARACPPEDCGGIWGYGSFLEAINDPSHEEHESMLEWIGGRFDPEAFNLAATNEALRRIR